MHHQANTAVSDETRRVLVAVWAEVLERPEESIDDADDFFSLGGDSVGAVLVCTYIEESVGTSISLALFMSNPTIRGLLDYLTRNRAPVDAPE